MKALYQLLAIVCLDLLIQLHVVLLHGFKNRRERVQWYRQAGAQRSNWTAAAKARKE